MPLAQLSLIVMCLPGKRFVDGVDMPPTARGVSKRRRRDSGVNGVYKPFNKLNNNFKSIQLWERLLELTLEPPTHAWQ